RHAVIRNPTWSRSLSEAGTRWSFLRLDKVYSTIGKAASLHCGRPGCANLGRDATQVREHRADVYRGRRRITQPEVQRPVHVIQPLIRRPLARLGLDDAKGRAERSLRFLDRAEDTRGEKGEDGRAESGDRTLGNENRLAEHVCVDAIEHVVLLRYPAAVYHAVDRHAVLRHSFEYDARVERGPLDCGEQLVARVVVQIPAECHTAKMWIHEHRAVAVVPHHAQQSGLPRAIVLHAGGKFFDRASASRRDGLEDAAHAGQSRLDGDIIRMRRSLHHSADTRHALDVLPDGNNAGGRPDYVDDVAFDETGTDGVPVRVECTNRNWNSRLEAELRGPIRGQFARDMIRREIAALQLRAHARQQRIHSAEELLRWEPAELLVPEPLVSHGADRAGDLARIGDTAERRGNHVAILERCHEPVALVGIRSEEH